MQKSIKKIFRRAKLISKVLAGKEFLIKPDIAAATQRFGSDYGGWDVVTSGLDSHAVVYSFGIGEDASFDVDIIKSLGVTVHAFDPTPKSIEWAKKQGFSQQFVMHEYGIAAFDGTISFNPPENSEHVSYTVLDRPSTEDRAISVSVKKLSTILTELGHDHIDVLKMDIEGAEYDVIDDIAQTDVRPGQILIEFHHRFPNVGVEKSTGTIAKIKAMGYKLFAVSSTNEEFCFVHDAKS